MKRGQVELILDQHLITRSLVELVYMEIEIHALKFFSFCIVLLLSHELCECGKTPALPNEKKRTNSEAKSSRYMCI